MAEVDRMAAELRTRPAPVSEPDEFDDTDDLTEEEDQPDVVVSATPGQGDEVEADIAASPVSHAAPVSETAQAEPLASSPGAGSAMAEVSSDP
ncbi:MAG: hypothetical protein J0I86_16010, partial [Mesorhizobium sp.]|nr:hypothetical protein [Mesorhizobium sp.]